LLASCCLEQIRVRNDLLDQVTSILRLWFFGDSYELDGFNFNSV